ncbi:MAG: hypothetical protein RMJ19_08895 [Gemmatales bacterium]|nr:hypothetical protein [Gemmatales bacterium]MCS7160575.1 hypothetical protein [Gemmatales bacterium]MDW8175776.1 hypothetical protein [Gemmatales bacterium]MDW8222434.1 hypothetical protein [Gemmatales bacterium]
MRCGSDNPGQSLKPRQSCYWARFGVIGYCARFHYLGAERLYRGQRVLLRSHRGLELGQVLWADDTPDASGQPGLAAPLTTAWPVTGTILRPIGPTDPWLVGHDQKLDTIHRWFEQRLADANAPGTICDVEYVSEPDQLEVLYLGLEAPTVARISVELEREFQLAAEWYDAGELLAADHAWEQRLNRPSHRDGVSEADWVSGCGGQCRCSMELARDRPAEERHLESAVIGANPTSVNAFPHAEALSTLPTNADAARVPSAAVHRITTNGSSAHGCNGCLFRAWLHKQCASH